MPNNSAGTSGQILTSAGVNAAPTWTTPSTTAASATILATARNINGVSFDGSADITVTADAGTLTGASLKSTITGSSLTSVGTLASATVNGKVIVGASSAASASAVLEASSTTQGFLPPRMTYNQRNLISSATAGLVLWCTNCGNAGQLQVYNGTQWTNMIGGLSATPPLVIGESALGGIVAYILQNGDPGYDASVQHGFIIPADYRFSQNKVTSGWGCENNVLSGADATALGSGNQNTLDITIACLSASAAKHCLDLVTGGYSDWYLPSKDELWKIFLNRSVNGITNGDAFWSSSEINSSDAWVISFSEATTLQQIYKGYTNYSVLPIRSF
jgi:hypothetical protein